MNLAFFIGLRYTGARQQGHAGNRHLVNFLSRVSIAGLVVGVAVLITVLSVMNGFDRELRERILGLLPQGIIYHRDGIQNWPGLQQQLERHEDIVAAAPFVQLNGLLHHKSNTAPVIIYGIAPEQEVRVSLIDNYLDADTLKQLATESDSTYVEAAIILGQGVASKLEVGIGDKIMLVLPRASSNSAPKLAYFSVAAVVSTQTEVDNNLAMMSLSQAMYVSETPDSISGMRLKLTDLFDAPHVVYEQQFALGEGYFGTEWTRTHGNLYQAIQMSKSMVGMLVSLIVAIAVFNVVSTLVMVVVDKRADIAILKTLGMSSRKIMAIFMLQGSMIGLIGTLLGVALGLLFASYAEQLVRILEQLLGVQFLQSDVYPITYLPTEIRFSDVLSVTLTAMTMSFLATLYPAWRASRVAPAQALRCE